MVGEEVLTLTIGGSIKGVIIEEKAEERWIRSEHGTFVKQELREGKWETTITGSPHCFHPAHES